MITSRSAYSCLKYLFSALAVGLISTTTAQAATFTVLNTNSSGPDSLAAAIAAANADAVRDTIEFQIPGSGVKTITLTSSTPLVINQPVEINGYTQPGASENTIESGAINAVPLIEINGNSGSNPGASGLTVRADDVTIRGLIINRCQSSGISGTGSNLIIGGCFIGVGADGSTLYGNAQGDGINMLSPSGVQIGTGALADRNVISGNGGDGISLFTGSDHKVAGNLIGTDKTGTLNRGNVGTGVVTTGTQNVIIGGSTFAERNIISGNGSGIVLFADFATVQNNFIGTSRTGVTAIPNKSSGIFMQGTVGNLIGGDTNVGQDPLLGQGNLISGNTGDGIFMNGNDTNEAGGNFIYGNIIGATLLNGGIQRALPNGAAGIVLLGSGSGGSNRVGGTIEQSNFIVANGGNGITITGQLANFIEGNTIGVSLLAGSNDPGGNGEAGIEINNAAFNQITSNTIAGNIENGITITDTAVTGNTLSQNGFEDNGGLAIDIGPSGVTENDLNDANPPTGQTSNPQNFPVIQSVTSIPGAVRVTGTLDSRPFPNYTIQVFGSPTADPSGHGEGRTYLGSVDTSSNATWTLDIPGGNINQIFSATATDNVSQTTSEMSANFDDSSLFVVTNTNDSGAGSLRAAIIAANSTAGANTITFKIAGSGPHTISPTSQLPSLVDNGTTINGYSQSGATPNSDIIHLNTNLRIAIDGTNAGTNRVGLNVQGQNCIITGLSITNFDVAGVRFTSANALSNRLEGCWIGVRPDGTGAGNGLGVLLEQSATRNTIGGRTDAAINLISGNTLSGVSVRTGAFRNFIGGNYIGTVAGADSALPNTVHGVEVFTTGNSIGTSASTRGNLISGNGENGIFISGPTATANQILGNRIGSSSDGSFGVINGGDGVNISGGAANTVIGRGGANNISGNTGSGVSIDGSNGTIIEDNLIGGLSNDLIANKQYGVVISDSSNSLIDNNTIAGNDLDGVTFIGGNNNKVQNSVIHDNGGLGIDLEDDGVDNPSDIAGANGRLKYPTITAIDSTNGFATMSVKYTVNAPVGNYTVTFFRNLVPDSSGFGEGQFPLATVTITKNLPTEQSFTSIVTGGVSGDYLTATLTGTTGTSEFSAAPRIGDVIGGSSVVNTTADILNPGDTLNSLREAIIYANSRPGTRITFAIGGDGARLLRPKSALPTITAPGTFIDGFSQPGSENATPNNSVRRIQVLGVNLPRATDIFNVDASGVQISGLVISSGPRHGVRVLSGSVFLNNDFISNNAADGVRILTGATGAIRTGASRTTQATAATVQSTSIINKNGGLAINYLNNGDTQAVTNNDNPDADGIPNFPVITGTTTIIGPDGLPRTRVLGTLNAQGSTPYKITAYFNQQADFDDHGEASVEIGSANIVTNSSGFATWSITGMFVDSGYISALTTITPTPGVAVSGEFAATVAHNIGNSLELTGLPTVLREGNTPVTVTISRPTAGPPLTITLQAFQASGMLSDEVVIEPQRIDFKAGQQNDTFKISARDDAIVDGETPVLLLALAGTSLAPTGGIIRVQDNDTPKLSISPKGPITVTEGGAAITVTITRNIINNAARVNLAASPSNQLTLSRNFVTFNQGEAQKTITVRAFNDTIVDGNVPVVLTASNTDYPNSVRTFIAEDNDLNSLRITLPAQSHEEDHTPLIGTVRRFGGNGGRRRVNLIADKPNQLNLPEFVIIPDGDPSATFEFTVVDDSVRETSPLPVRVTGRLNNAPQVSAFATTQVMDDDLPGDSLIAWALNEYGQVGNNSTNNKLEPAAVGLNGVVSISANGSHSLAVLDNGTIRAWGYNGGGQIGDGTTTNRHTPVTVPGLSNIRAVSAGWYHSLALRGDGTVWAWGYNKFGQLGDGSTVNRLQPVRVQGLTGIRAISAGVYFSLALKHDGTVWAWGNNAYGQLGNNARGTDSLVPKQVPAFKSGVIGISAGGGHALYLLDGGTVYAAGWNQYGQLGDGTTQDYAVPVRAKSVTMARSVSAGYVHSLALVNNGNVVGWGNNSYGQLGLGNISHTNVRGGVVLVGLATAISAGANFSAILTADGVRVTGGNNYGQLGNGTVSSGALTPQQVNGILEPSKVSSGYGHLLAVGKLILPGAVRKPSAKQF